MSEESAIYRPTNWLDQLDWNEVFASAIGPVEIDVGCGKGGFLLWAAQARPEVRFVGLERQLVRVHKVDKKIVRAGLTNVRLIRVEASYFIGKLVAEQSVAAYHINFPDPWPKRRHAKHRLFQPTFVTDLCRTLGKGGVVHVATDDLDYFACIQQVMRASGRFREEPAEDLPAEAATEFERIFRAQGKPIGRAKFVAKNPAL